MKPEILALISVAIVHFAFAIADSLWKVPLREVSAEKGIFIRNLWTTTFLGIVAWIMQENHHFSWQDVVFSVLMSFVSYWGLYFFVKSQQYLPLSLIGRFLALSSFFHFWWSIVYYKEPFVWQKAILFGISFFASLLITFKTGSINAQLQHRGILFAVLAGIFWAISYAFFKETTEKLGPSRFGFILELTILCVSGFQLLWQRKFTQTFTLSGKSFLFLLLIAFLGALGVYFSNLSYLFVPLSSLLIIRVIGDTLPLAIGVFIYKEKLTYLQYIGIILSLIANWGLMVL
ncbi:EamA family transporter [Raineya sp.]|jgi:drug/metabolite transporter (DMT)-like permease